MSGIAGFFPTAFEPRLTDELKIMLDRMASKRDSVSGQARHAHSVVGWQAQPESVAAKAPIWNSDRTLCLIFSGETHSDPGHEVAADGLLRLYETLGLESFSRLNGWFSGVIIDNRSQTATLFNDRYGMGRIYYHESPGTFTFASEAKALLAIFPRTRELNQQSLAEYMSVGCVLQNRTLYRNIFLLPPGSAWTFHRDGRIKKETYFDPSIWEQQERLSPEAYSEHLRDVFARAVPRYFREPTRTALSLTGGLDSRMVLAWAGAAPGTLPCYTFGGPYRDCADVTIARALAKVTHQPHRVLPIEADFFSNFHELAAETIRVSDGTMDVSGAVELYMNRKASAIAPIRITGNYGSEILRSNVAFRPRKLDRSLYTPEFNQLLDGAEETYRTEATGHRLSFIAFKQVPWHHYSRYSVEKAILTPRSPFLDNEVVALAYRAPKGTEESAEPLLRLIADGNGTLGKMASDRALRHGSVSVLAPLQRQWQEFTAKAEYAYDYGMPQWLARADRVVSPLHLERLFLGRHKFYHFRIWYRDALKAFIQEATNCAEKKLSCYRSGIPAKLANAHTSSRANHTLDLHRIASLVLVERFSQNAVSLSPRNAAPSR